MRMWAMGWWFTMIPKGCCTVCSTTTKAAVASSRCSLRTGISMRTVIAPTVANPFWNVTLALEQRGRGSGSTSRSHLVTGKRRNRTGERNQARTTRSGLSLSLFLLQVLVAAG